MFSFFLDFFSFFGVDGDNIVWGTGANRANDGDTVIWGTD